MAWYFTTNDGHIIKAVDSLELSELTAIDNPELIKVEVEGDLLKTKNKLLVNGEFVDMTISAEDARTRRNQLLDQSDWTQIPDCTADKAAWATYRQLLRLVPQQVEFPQNINWPTPPTT
jgi:FtsZ-binding cell division protein ZapB